MAYSREDPHAGQPVLQYGRAPAAARLAVILVHGRGGSAADMLHLAEQFDSNDIAYLAPQAAGHSWYPQSFLAPMKENEPGLSSGLRVLSRLIEGLGVQSVLPERIVLLGFSQGACLTLEFAARRAQRYAGLVGLSGGLIGPEGTPRDYSGSLEATHVFLGCSDIDPHIPLQRVQHSAEVFRRLGAQVDERIYRGMGHTINHDEIEAANALLKAVHTQA